MCGRYILYEAGDISERFAAELPIPEIRSNWNVAPGQIMPVITQRGSERKAELMKWGLIPSWAKDEKIGYKMINARSESIFDKPAWRGSVKHRRCLIPARGFYEWKRQQNSKTKQPFMIRPASKSLFAFAGIYSSWKSPDNITQLLSYSIVTTAPNQEMETIHDRMPVILDESSEGIWLDPTLEDKDILAELLHPYPDNSLEIYQVSTDVNTIKNNDGKLIEPINSQ